MNASEARDIWGYDPDTGILTWKITPSYKVKAGDVAGCHSGNGYRQVIYNNTKHYVHRLVWLMQIGRWPEYEIDHINKVKDDNRWINLRDVPPHINKTNMPMSSRNLSGTTGVSQHYTGCWVAILNFKGVRHYLGMFKQKDQAISARKAAEIQYGFTND